ncbi:hypothetical protein TI04_12770, partial [Achromatium sp. WMS2]
MLNHTLVLIRLVLLTLLIAPSTYATESNCAQAAVLVKQALKLGDNPAVLQQQQHLLTQAVAMCAENATAQHNLGVIYELQGQYELALTQYRQALALEPAATAPWLGIGDVWFALGQYPLSLEAYLKICAKEPDARHKITKLLHGQSYKNVAADKQFNRASLALLYDQPRLAQLHQHALSCQKQFKSVINLGVTKAITVPEVVFHNLQFNIG